MFVPPLKHKQADRKNHFVSGVKVVKTLTHRSINAHVNTHMNNPTQVSRRETEAGNNDSISNIKKSPNHIVL